MEDARSIFIPELLLRSLRFLSFISSQDSIANLNGALVIAAIRNLPVNRHRDWRLGSASGPSAGGPITVVPLKGSQTD